jgi:hypothetical protein
MQYIKSFLLGIASTLLVASTVSAQWNVARFATERNRVYTTFGVDPAFVGSVGYGRVVPVFSHDIQLTGDVGIATARADVRDFRARVGLQSSLLRWRSLNLTGSATFITRGTDNVIYTGLNFGADIAGTAGIYRPRWFAVGEYGFDKAVITHVHHSAYYRSTFYPDAKDGWYLDAGGTYHYGGAVGVTIAKTELVARAGWMKTENYKSLMPPMYVSVGVGVGF